MSGIAAIPVQFGVFREPIVQHYVQRPIFASDSHDVRTIFASNSARAPALLHYLGSEQPSAYQLLNRPAFLLLHSGVQHLEVWDVGCRAWSVRSVHRRPAAAPLLPPL